jgi:signal transduction histidine kinase
MKPVRRWQSYRLSGWLAAGVCVAVAILGLLGLRASRDFRRSSLQLAQRRADEGARLLAIAVARDMRAAQNTVLSSPTWEEFGVDTHEAMTLVASAFARYPYPEAFFAWRGGTRAEELVFFTRSDRSPSWISEMEEPDRYPVRRSGHPGLAARILNQLNAHRAPGLFVVSELNVDSVPYQVIVRLKYQDGLRQELGAVYGFMVNLEWAREHYFSELTRQVLSISSDGPGVTFSIFDDRNVPVVGAALATSGLAISRRTLPLAFFDPLQSRSSNLEVRNWTILASAAVSPVSPVLMPGLDLALGIAMLAAVALALSLVLTARAMRTGAQLAEMRADFMSSVTHELKTPIASIRAMADTLVRGRLRDSSAQREYAAVVVQETRRLSRLVDNVLAHARITDVADVYSFERIDVDELVDTALAGFKYQLQQGQFAVTLDLPPDLPAIHADRPAMDLLLDNLIDNSIRYSNGNRELRIACRVDGGLVALRVSDSGIGIESRDLERVTQKFVRGQNAPKGGSGLGLAIVERIANDHGGKLSIWSWVGHGTTVEVTLPIAADDPARNPVPGELDGGQSADSERSAPPRPRARLGALLKSR